MHHYNVTLPEVGLVAATRGMLGAGIGFLLAHKLDEKQRKAVGWALVGVGVATTIPLALEIIGHRAKQKPELEECSPAI
jgi:uncharacterized membrane protein YfcA